MVNVTDKSITYRTASARAIVKIGPKITKLIKDNNIKKGDVLSIAQIAGIIGAKKTSELIPLCHNIGLTNVKVIAGLNVKNQAVEIHSTVQCEAKTGVEMEALTAVSIAALTVYDMCKAVSHDITIQDVCLISKTGGARGDYTREDVIVRPYETEPISREGVCLGTF